jgi:hypothetical protein
MDYMIHSQLNFRYQVNGKATQQCTRHKTITTHHEAQYYSEGNDLLNHAMGETQTLHYELENISRRGGGLKKYHDKKIALILYFSISSY